MTTANRNTLYMIAAERQRQVTEEGWTPEHDDLHDGNQLAMAAACYASPTGLRAHVDRASQCGCRSAGCQHQPLFANKWVDAWPWDKQSDKRAKHDRVRQLVIAGALIVAEIERLGRLEEKQDGIAL